ncbi:cyclohexadienyl dehydrogenase [Tistrella bauzanensis]|uniref:Cyclohexadienyl dehydrogenase n=1 Tax=Tistrella bauzanensis TaxID=657419 RepID=A0ABQ1IDY7_9PROT|nr:prephenate/arogenate dehydrogenase family protein [Tistrella bauzanensis]GGB35533.1 cyclohexadienyl dehydrogenase [Tistrella bauzanensis]
MVKNPPVINRLAILGIGLIGSSVSRAARQYGAAARVVAYDTDGDRLARALALGAIDDAAASLEDAVTDADMVVMCAPVGAMGAIARQAAPAMRAGAILSDVGSTKTSVVADVLPVLHQGVHFIPAHPVAGTEKSGPENGFATLFDGRWCILTPPEGADTAAVDLCAAFWRALGSNVDVMTPEHHDTVLAITSHLPHLISYTIVGTVMDLEEHHHWEVFKYAAGGFRDFSRLAGSDPVMWRDVFLNNRDAVLEMLGRFTEDLQALQRAIRWGDAEKLEALFTRTRDARRQIIEARQA